MYILIISSQKNHRVCKMKQISIYYYCLNNYSIMGFTFFGLSLSAMTHGELAFPVGDFEERPPVYSWVMSPRFLDGTGLGLAGGVDVLTMA